MSAFQIGDRVKFRDVSDGDNMIAPSDVRGKIGTIKAIEDQGFLIGKPRVAVIEFKKLGLVKALSTNFRRVGKR